MAELIEGFDAYVNDAFGASNRAHASIVGPPQHLPSAAGRLLEREVEVLGLLAEGRSNREIAIALEISVHTAKFHVDRILLKLEASSRTDAVVRAVRLGLLTL